MAKEQKPKKVRPVILKEPANRPVQSPPRAAIATVLPRPAPQETPRLVESKPDAKSHWWIYLLVFCLLALLAYLAVRFGIVLPHG